jgi:hypothetical protein
MSYSMFQAPALSFFNKDFYKSIGREKNGTGLLYLFVIVAAASLLSTCFACVYLYMDIKSPRVTEIAKLIPEIRIKDGHLSMDKPSPYVLTLDQAGSSDKVNLVFDPEGKSSWSEGQFLFREDGLMTDGKEEGMLRWKSLIPFMGNDFKTGPSSFQDLLAKAIPWFFGLGILAIPFIYLGHIFVLMIYALVGLIMDKSKLGFGTAMRVAAVAMTPSIVLDALFHAAHLGIVVALWFLVSIPLSLGYLFFGYSAINSAESSQQS